MDAQGHIIPGRFTTYKLNDFLLRLHGAVPGYPRLPNLKHIGFGGKPYVKPKPFINAAQRRFLFPEAFPDERLQDLSDKLEREQHELMKGIRAREHKRRLEERRVNRQLDKKSKSPKKPRRGETGKGGKGQSKSPKRKRSRSKSPTRGKGSAKYEEKIRETKRPRESEGGGRAAPKAPKRKSTSGKCNRDMSCVFDDGEQIKHTYGGDDWIGTYVRARDVIHRIRDYDTPTAFALAHIHETNPSRASINGWDYCKVKRGSLWVDSKNLPCTFCPGKYSYDEEEMY